MTSARSYQDMIPLLTLDEKIALVSGNGLWRTAGIERLGIPAIVMTDGTYGVRYSVEQIDRIDEGADALEQFLSVVNTRADDDVAATFGTTLPATCFPNGSLLGCSWDVELAHELGAALATECQSMGVGLLLGPGINIRRTPLAGRSYEYYSEDPYVTGDIAAAVIGGLQDNGVGASLKHFACNNSEIERTSMDSVVDERALREIYLKGFERAIAAADPWTVMSSYNRLNGVQAAENPWLLTGILRDDWGYAGCVVSDWHGIKDRPASLRAGNDLDMPESAMRKATLREAVLSGAVPLALLDRSCARVLALVEKCVAGRRADVTMDSDGHHDLARRIATESIVLLKNDGAALPIEPSKARRILIVGPTAVDPIIQGSGCATTRPTRVDVPLDEIRAVAAGAGFDITHLAGFSARADDAVRLREQAVEAARTVDHVVVFVHGEMGYDGEGSDRKTLSLGGGQDDLVTELGALPCAVTVVVTAPDAVTLPWVDRVSGIFISYFAGQGFGRAIADLLFGHANPSGRLSASLPARIEDIPGWLSYPGEGGRHLYSESLFVGYRHYDRKKIDPVFPFGWGLGYTEFDYSDLRVDDGPVSEGQTLRLRFKIRNTGARAGAEVVQIYARWPEGRVARPVRELKAFRKIVLDAGEEREVAVAVPVDDLRYYDIAVDAWQLDDAPFRIEVASSSRTIRLTETVRPDPKNRIVIPLGLETLPNVLLDRPGAEARLVAWLANELDIPEGWVRNSLVSVRQSFFGIYYSLSWAYADRIDRARLQALLDEINQLDAADA